MSNGQTVFHGPRPIESRRTTICGYPVEFTKFDDGSFSYQVDWRNGRKMVHFLFGPDIAGITFPAYVADRTAELERTLKVAVV